METNRNRLASVTADFDQGADSALTLEDIASQWLEDSTLHIKESSYIKYRNIVKNHILPDLGNVPLSRLTTENVGAFARQKLEGGRKDGKGGLADKTVKDILTVLKSLCIYGAQLDVASPCRFDAIRLRRGDRRTRILGREESTMLGQFLLKDESLEKTGVLLSLFMGLRLGEVCALKKENVLYDEKVLQIRSTMQRLQNKRTNGGRKTKVVITKPKSEKAVRDIPIPEFLLERLSVVGSMPKDAFLLTGNTERFIEPRTMENIFKRYLEKCGMPHINYHALRHTFATRCIEAGFDAKSLSEILGHANVNITLNRYVHSSMEQKRENMGKLKMMW